MKSTGTEYRDVIFNSINWKVEWSFPADNAHDGIPIANGMFGVLIHGRDNILKLSINRADFWDHRGGLIWDERMSYRNVMKILKEKNQEELSRIFARTQKEGFPARPTHLPMGRYEILFEEGSRLVTGCLNIVDGEAAVTVEKEGKRSLVRIHMIKDEPLIAISVEGGARFVLKPVLVTKESLRPKNGEPSSAYTVSYPFPHIENGYAGWCQELPADPALAVLSVVIPVEGKNEIYIAAVRGESVRNAVNSAVKLLDSCKNANYKANTLTMAGYWEGFWKKSALIKLEDKEIEKLYYLGIYKMASISMAGGPPSTTQGPWIEDYRMPAWSSDYHFNVNVQECYWPAYASNNLEVLDPLFQMVGGWKDKMRDYAKFFVGIEDGLQIPWAVDELCTSMGGSWMGAIDHGSTAWLGHLMWQYYRYSMDEKFLIDTVYPFLRGAFRVYQEMLEWDGEKYWLPITVSSEFKWDKTDCWGANGTFQLINIHFLCKSLIYIISNFGIDDNIIEACKNVQDHLPLYSKGHGSFGDEIFVWDEQPLTESHRHHSHLAGIYPYDLINYSVENDREIIKNSFKTWANIGMGAWTGWCVPWAVILHARTGNGNMAEMLLQIFRRAFIMKGYASSHDTVFTGLSVFDKMKDVMQVEASISVANSILEMLMFTSNNRMNIFPAIPKLWANVSYAGIRSEGGFLVDGEMIDGKIKFARVKSECGQELILKNPVPGRAKIKWLNTDKEEVMELQDEIRISTRPGDCIEITPL